MINESSMKLQYKHPQKDWQVKQNYFRILLSYLLGRENKKMRNKNAGNMRTKTSETHAGKKRNTARNFCEFSLSICWFYFVVFPQFLSHCFHFLLLFFKKYFSCLFVLLCFRIFAKHILLNFRIWLVAVDSWFYWFPENQANNTQNFTNS